MPTIKESKHFTMQERKIQGKKLPFLCRLIKGEYAKVTKIYDAANWSKHEDDFTQMFYNQNVKQFWLPEEIALKWRSSHMEVLGKK